MGAMKILGIVLAEVAFCACAGYITASVATGVWSARFENLLWIGQIGLFFGLLEAGFVIGARALFGRRSRRLFLVLAACGNLLYVAGAFVFFSMLATV